jgi:hypothetical protein
MMKNRSTIALICLALGTIGLALVSGYFRIQDQQMQGDRNALAVIIRELRESPTHSASESPPHPAIPDDAISGEDALVATSPPLTWEELFAERDRLWESQEEWIDVRDRNTWVRKLRDWPRDDVAFVLRNRHRQQQLVADLGEILRIGDSIPSAYVNQPGAWGGLPDVVDLSLVLFMYILMEGAQGDTQEAINGIGIGMLLADKVVGSLPDSFDAHVFRSRIQVNMVEALEETFIPEQLNRAETLALIGILHRPLDWSHLYNSFLISQAEAIQFSLENRQKYYGMSGFIRTFQLSQTPVDLVRGTLWWGRENTLMRPYHKGKFEREVGELRYIRSIEAYPYHLIPTDQSSSQEKRALWNLRHRMGYPTHVQARLNMSRVGLLVELYHSETGRLPDALSLLESTYGVVLAKDPCTGRALHYIRKGDGFLLYSAGISGIDYKGEHEGRRFNHSTEPRSVVWRGANYYEGRHPDALTDTEWETMLADSL